MYLSRVVKATDAYRRDTAVREVTSSWAEALDADASLRADDIAAFEKRGNGKYSGAQVNDLLPQLDDPTFCAMHYSAFYPVKRAVARLALENRLASGPPGGTFVALAGGGGSGKSSLAAEIARRYQHTPEIIFDSTFRSAEVARRWVDRARAASMRADVYFIYRPAADAVRTTVHRALESGRTHSVTSVLASHRQVPPALAELTRTFRAAPDVGFFFIDNSRGRGEHGPVESLSASHLHRAAEAARAVSEFAVLDDMQRIVGRAERDGHPLASAVRIGYEIREARDDAPDGDSPGA